jgi:hypothetical protein
MQEQKEYIRTSLRIEKQLWKEFKKWLIENDYKSFHQFVVECMEKALKGELKPKHKKKEKNA